MGLALGGTTPASQPVVKPLPVKPAAPAAPAASPGGYSFLDPNSAYTTGAQLLPTSLAKSGAQLYSPGLAASLAGTQYDQAITDAKQNLAMTQAGAAQALANVQNWWSAILGGQQQQAGQDQTATTNMQNTEAQNSASILASLGGGANQGAEGVGVAAQNGQNMLAALGLNNEHYNNDLGTALRESATGAYGQQQNANQTNIAQAMQKVNDQISAKGAAQVQNQFQVDQLNNTIRDNQAGRLLQIDQANNQTRDNQATRFDQIVGANNDLQHNIDTMTEQQKNDARNFAINLRQLNDSEKQTKLGVALSTASTDPTTGKLLPGSAAYISKLSGVPAAALEGVSPKQAAAQIAATAKASAVAAAAGVKAGMVDDSASAKRGLLVDHNGNPILNTQKQPIVMPGWSIDAKSPSGVSRIPFGQPGSTMTASESGQPSASATASMQKTVVSTVGSWLSPKSTLTSVPYTDKNNQTAYHTVREPGQALSWPQMQSQVAGMTDPREQAMYSKYLDKTIPQGTHDRPFTTDTAGALKDALHKAQVAKQAGMDGQTFVHNLLQNPLYQTQVGHDAILKAIKSVWQIDLSQDTPSQVDGPPAPVQVGGTTLSPARVAAIRAANLKNPPPTNPETVRPG